MSTLQSSPSEPVTSGLLCDSQGTVFLRCFTLRYYVQNGWRKQTVEAPMLHDWL